MLENTYTELRDRLIKALSDAYAFQDKLSFLQEVTDWHEVRRRLPEIRADLANLRSGGFRWLPLLEKQLAEALAVAPDAHAGLWLEVDHSTLELLPRVSHLLRTGQALVFQGEYDANAHRVDLFVATWEGLRREIQLAVDRARASVELSRKRLDDLAHRLDLVRSFATRRAAATFALEADEDPVFVVQATWKEEPRGDWKGWLYLTPRRIVFERDEIVKTSTGIFSSRSERIHQPVFAGSLTALAASDEEKVGFFLFKDDVLSLAWKPGLGLPPRTRFEIASQEGTTRFWDEVVEALVEGRLEALLASDADAAEVDARMVAWQAFVDAHRHLTESPEQGTNGLQILHDLLYSLFVADELKRFIALDLGQEELLASLPPDASTPARYFFEAATALLRRGLLDARFVDALVRARPNQEQRIRADLALVRR